MVFLYFRIQRLENYMRHFGIVFTLCLKYCSMLVRYLDIENGKWSGNGMEIENDFEYA